MAVQGPAVLFLASGLFLSHEWCAQLLIYFLRDNKIKLESIKHDTEIEILNWKYAVSKINHAISLSITEMQHKVTCSMYSAGQFEYYRLQVSMYMWNYEYIKKWKIHEKWQIKMDTESPSLRFKEIVERIVTVCSLATCGSLPGSAKGKESSKGSALSHREIV